MNATINYQKVTVILSELEILNIDVSNWDCHINELDRAIKTLIERENIQNSPFNLIDTKIGLPISITNKFVNSKTIMKPNNIKYMLHNGIDFSDYHFETNIGGYQTVAQFNSKFVDYSHIKNEYNESIPNLIGIFQRQHGLFETNVLDLITSHRLKMSLIE